ncbi:MAG TPA: methionine--tRNA ligase [Alphaproteobacteria bacterium]|nr:methionine--tRNA ligase [Alphaproteobacteria bacterium]
MTAERSFYITTPIYYVNDAPHVGHAYTTLACDVLARFMRLDGYRVKFLTGTDEHGQKVEKAAAAAGIAPQAFTDKVSQNFRDLAKALNISNDDFIRTTEERHVIASQAIWQAIAARKSPKGRENIYLGKYAGWYAVRDEAFYGENELTTGADGKKRAPSGAEVEWVEEPSYFFRLSDWQEWLLDYYKSANPSFIGPASRRNEVISFVEQGLEDLSISRTTFMWGIPVPGDSAHIMYVWLDALTNYVTAVGYPDTKSDEFTTFWPADLHMVGKDILRFHAVYWPAFLKAADLAPPKRVFAHGWWTVEGQKMSKSLGNVIDPHALAVKYGLDPVRYFLLREVPFGQDGDFSHRALVRRLNSDLANDLGNLAQRVLSFIAKNAGGVVPLHGKFIKIDSDLLVGAGPYLYQSIKRDLINLTRDDKQAQHLDVGYPAFHRALEAIWATVGEANLYVDAQAPWKLRKEDPARMNTVLYVLAETLRCLALLIHPFMPDSMDKLLDQLAVPKDARRFDLLGEKGRLVPGTKLPKPEGIFPRYLEADGEAAS